VHLAVAVVVLVLGDDGRLANARVAVKDFHLCVYVLSHEEETAKRSYPEKAHSLIDF